MGTLGSWRGHLQSLGRPGRFPGEIGRPLEVSWSRWSLGDPWGGLRVLGVLGSSLGGYEMAFGAAASAT